ncbi:hypothetical protein JAAARDRAFT_143923 [Jaapia argillacea MUCL 33604]|uniref:HECT domain-containing protein n=1 Tax=Jaapia argillacea MUCL 33604 TaxID=933084 RepID=A0A067P2V7_9AGAM|nr:hypothetical protein JAAARDRAFT_143923 [Jaapia argillacea MUCL 33604]
MVLGLSTLDGPLRQQVNRTRLASNAATAPRQPPLPVRRRVRGVAAHPPSLPNPRLGVQQCFTTPFNGLPNSTVRITVQVYPPQVSLCFDDQGLILLTFSLLQDPAVNLYLYRFRKDSLCAQLNSFGLLLRYEIPLSTHVTTFLQQVSQDMEDSPFQYQFSDPGYETEFAHENLALQLLSLVNRGSPRTRDNQIRLQRVPLSTDTVIEQLAHDRLNYANSMLCVDNDRFIIRLGSAMLPDSGGNLRRHHCISSKVYGRFRLDGTNRNDGEDEVPTENESSCGESDSEDDVEVPHQQAPVSSAVHSRPTRLVNPLPVLRTNDPTQRPRSSGQSPPLSLWSELWIPSDIRSLDMAVADSLPESAYLSATRGEQVPDLELSGVDMESLVVALKEKILDCIRRSDFTNLMSPSRDYLVIGHMGMERSRNVRSSGEGVEREVLSTLYQQFHSETAEWFSPNPDDYVSIATSLPLSCAGYLSRSQKLGLTCLGAVIGLMLLNGFITHPFDPVVIQYLIHGRDINSISKAFLAQWHPDIKQTICDFIDLGPNGNLAPFQPYFSTYFDIQVASLRNHDMVSHLAIASEMLRRSIIGPESCSHPEWDAVEAGFQLPCQNGFSTSKASCRIACINLLVIRCYPGGSEAFITALYSCHISSFINLQPHLRIRAPTRVLSSSLSEALGTSDHTFSSLLTDFLEGTGIPCPHLFADHTDHFDRIINLAEVDTPGFRARMFCWASTGIPTIQLDNPLITVWFVSDQDPSYAADTIRAPMIAHGKICFKTCSKQARIPATHITRLAQVQYDGSTEPKRFRDAFDHWLLTEILTAIGAYSIS